MAMQTRNVRKIISRFHFNVFFTVMCWGPKKRGAVTAAEGTSEAKFATKQMITDILTRLTLLPLMAGITKPKKSSMDTTLETKFVITRHKRTPIPTRAAGERADVMGASTLLSAREMPVSAELTALPSTTTAPMKIRSVMGAAVASSENLAIGFPSTRMIQRRQTAKIAGTVFPQAFSAVATPAGRADENTSGTIHRSTTRIKIQTDRIPLRSSGIFWARAASRS